MRAKLKTLLFVAATLLGMQGVVPAAQAQSLPENISGPLARLVELYRTNPQAALRELQTPRELPPMLASLRGTEPLVGLYLDGSVPLAALVNSLEQQGIVVSATSDHGRGRIEAYIPLGSVVKVAGMDGVRSVAPVYRPQLRVGDVTSQAVVVQNVLPVQREGFLGDGIRVGVLSDSYDATDSPTSAADDVRSGDLPGLLNPEGNRKPVVVLEDFISANSIDEGRAMLQLVHDIAPKAELGFATAFNGEVGFARNILALRREFDADIIVDDIIYFAEPFYSDGIVAQAVDQVVAEGATYFSSAGNGADIGYESTYRTVSRREAQRLVNRGQQNLRLDSVPESLANSFHDFHPGSSTDISQSITIPTSNAPAATVSFQWDEPFGLDRVNTDYNLLVFSSSGAYLGLLSGRDNNLSTDQPLELAFLPPGRYQLVISLANRSETASKRIKYVLFGDATGQYLSAPTIVGHAAARRGVAVGAIFYQTPSEPEEFTSLGPTVIAIDAQGNRLATPEVRRTPLVSGVDGTNTTFFFRTVDVEGDGFPNFFGTSAAAPNVAAVAALVLEAAGGPGSITPFQIKSVLAATARDAGETGYDNLTGFGLVDAGAAIDLVQSRQ